MKPIRRRDFLKQSSIAAGAGIFALGASKSVAIVADPADAVAFSAPAKWAAGELRDALVARGVTARIVPSITQTAAGDLCIVASALPNTAGPEALLLAPGKLGSRSVLTASGSDPRGLVYALLEMADRVRFASDPLGALALRAAINERPANQIRSMARCFESDVEDKSWFYDRDHWRAYLSMLAAQRFNRFSLTLGLGYNFPRNATDVYFYFAYPFLVAVPGYNVRASGLPDSERARNLEMLRFISEETAARGLHFQLALWTHAYKWVDSPRANYTIEGLSDATHAAYSRDALTTVLKACPAISGVTFRVHGESGIPEGSYDFWKTVFDGVVGSGRRIEIDMHAKGMDQQTIDIALATSMPVNLSPKYWAEHMGLPYHQAAIRELERVSRETDNAVMRVSGGSRRFTRYGYADFLTEDRRYGILHRIWPGTQRVLLWGDPEMAAGYGRLASFCGSAGVEWYEPLSFKGRMGSGKPGGRCAYADTSLNPRYDWEKFLYTYRVWGRRLYNPDADPDTWRRQMRKELDAAAPAAEAALAAASRILPLVTTAHGVSGSNNTYWPEIYTNQPIVNPDAPHPYRDTLAPRRFGRVSPFDPQLFSAIDDFAEELSTGRPRAAKYSPADVARWLEEFANDAARRLKEAEAKAPRSPEFRRLAIDVAIQSGLGRFFASKMRAGVLWALYEQTDNTAALAEALKAYRAARAAWAEAADAAKGVYAADITYGATPHLRGHWADRLPAIDADIADMEKRMTTFRGPDSRTQALIRAVLSPPAAPPPAARHTPPRAFWPGQALALELGAEKSAVSVARLHYRHTNQAEMWRVTDMEWSAGRYAAAIPADYTQSPYALEYYFELRNGSGAWIYPGFEPALSNLPYFVVRHG